MDKITIEVSDLSKVSDGYHTIEELYDHRCVLWINLCLLINERQSYKCYLVKDHYSGWFLLGMETHAGQISYHCPNKFLVYVEGKIEERPDIIFDGHTSQDVLHRLKQLAV